MGDVRAETYHHLLARETVLAGADTKPTHRVDSPWAVFSRGLRRLTPPGDPLPRKFRVERHGHGGQRP